MDRELLELAAKAAGIDGEYESWVYQGFNEGIRQVLNGQKCTRPWNPLNHDDQALRLAVSLGLVVDCSRPSAGEPFKLNHVGQADFSDPYAATRRAIVRAAAMLAERGKG